MSGREFAVDHHRLRAPSDHGGVLLDPPLSTAKTLVEGNRELAEKSCGQGLGGVLFQATKTAQAELLRLARDYTSRYRNLPPSPPAEVAPILLAGHQPQLFHAGVWFKNFVLSSLGRQLSAHSVNLLADHDTAGAPSIRVPTGGASRPVVDQVLFDRSADEIPHEERFILDRDVFESFGSRAATAIAPFLPNPLIQDLWPLVRVAADRSQNLGQALAEGRHRLEAQCGLETLELPLSCVCETDSFRWFASVLWEDLPRLRSIYNSSLAEYRRANRIRSRSHPVPDLAQDGEYLEAPFWLWTKDDPRRRRLFARRHGRQIELTDRGQILIDLPPLDSSAEEAIARLAQASSEGVRLRPRALVTTMYCRLLLGDLFVHGIGGGKYDQLTDAIIARFFDRTPPAFLTATATMKLPIDRPGNSAGELLEFNRAIRDLRFHPESFLESPSPEAERIVAEKRRWLREVAPRGARLARHQGLERANQALQPFIEMKRRELLGARLHIESSLELAALLGSREFAFCLFPAEQLVPALKAAASVCVG